MLVLGSRLHDTPVMSLQTGGRLGRTTRPIIDPDTLRIVAYEVEGPLLTEKPSFLRAEDIREFGTVGMIIDSTDELVGADDVLKLKELREIDFRLVGLPVVDEHRHRLGKVDDYTVDTMNFSIEQLNVRKGIIKALADTGSLIHRSQIKEVNDRTIIVKSAKKQSLEPVIEPVRTDFVNPFRGTSPAPTPEPEN